MYLPSYFEYANFCWLFSRTKTFEYITPCFLFSFFLSFFQGWIDGVAILMAVLIVALVTAGNDYSKELQFRALEKTSEEGNRSMVLRDGVSQLVSGTDGWSRGRSLYNIRAWAGFFCS